MGEVLRIGTAQKHSKKPETDDMKKRDIFKLLLAGLVGLPLTGAWAQGNDRPVEWVHPYNAGGGSDAIARKLAETVGKQINRPVIVNNKPGGATNIAAAYVAQSKPNGNIVFTGDFATLAANPYLFSNLSYNSASACMRVIRSCWWPRATCRPTTWKSS